MAFSYSLQITPEYCNTVNTESIAKNMLTDAIISQKQSLNRHWKILECQCRKFKLAMLFGHFTIVVALVTIYTQQGG